MAPNDSAPAVFLDRDGTLMREVNYCADPKHVEIFPGVPEALVRLREAGYKLIVISNQAGIGRGYFTEDAISAGRSRSGARRSARDFRRRLFLSRSSRSGDRAPQTRDRNVARGATRSSARFLAFVFHWRQSARRRMRAQRRCPHHPGQDRLRRERNPRRDPIGLWKIFPPRPRSSCPSVKLHESSPPGSAHVSCAGDGVPPSRTFSHDSTSNWQPQVLSMRLAKFVAVRHRDQHARRVRYPNGQPPLHAVHTSC